MRDSSGCHVRWMERERVAFVEKCERRNFFNLVKLSQITIQRIQIAVMVFVKLMFMLMINRIAEIHLNHWRKEFIVHRSA